MLFRTLHRGLSQPIRYHNLNGAETEDLVGKSGTVGNSENSRKKSERRSSTSRFQTLQKLTDYLKMENTEALDNLNSLSNV